MFHSHAWAKTPVLGSIYRRDLVNQNCKEPTENPTQNQDVSSYRGVIQEQGVQRWYLCV